MSSAFETSQVALNVATARKMVSILAGGLAFGCACYLLYILGKGSHDFAEYEGLWQRLQGDRLADAFVRERIEIGSLFLFWALAQHLSAGATFFVTGLTAFSIKSFVISRHLQYAWLAWLLYVALFLYLHDANQLRAAIAACFILYALVAARSVKAHVILAAVATLFHYSGVIILALCFAPIPVVSLAATAFLATLWDVIISANREAFAVGLRYLADPNARVSMTNSNFLVQVFLCAVCVYEWRHLNALQRKGAYLLLTGATLYIAFRTNPIMAHRLRELSVLGVFPLLFRGPRRITDATLLILACVAFLAVYSVGIVVTRWAG